MNLRTMACKLSVVAILFLLGPAAVQAREEKAVSTEAILEELANLRNLVETQQRQIDELRAVVQPSSITAPVQRETAAPAEDLTKKVETLSSNLGGFKLSGDFRLRADAQLRSGNALAGPLQ